MLAVQETQDGTGHAVRVALDALRDAAGTTDGVVVVMAGDTPLMQGETLTGLVEAHQAADRAITVLTAEVADPFGYGRILRDASGSVTAIVEEKEASAEQAAVREINSGIFAFDGAFLADALGRITNDNAKGEYYLTDVVGIARQDGRAVGAHRIDDVMQTEGANDRVQLAGLAAELNRRILDRWMRDGVTIVDPASTWIDADVVLEPDVTILPGVQLLGATVVAEDAVVGPDCTLKDVEVGAGARSCARTGSWPWSAPAPPSDRSPTCDRAPSSARGARSAASWRPRTPGSARAPRSRTCPTSATPRSARAPTSAPARSSPTTTGSTSTARPSAGRSGPPRTTPSSRRSRSATVPRPAPAPSYGATCRPGRWRSRAGRSARSRAGRCASAPAPRWPPPRRPRWAGRPTPGTGGGSGSSHTDGTGLAPDGPSGSHSD